jgi:hypothetical protein
MSDVPFDATRPDTEDQVCQRCGHHVGADHRDQVIGRPVPHTADCCDNCSVCAEDLESRPVPPTAAALGMTDAESAWPDDRSDNFARPGFVTQPTPSAWPKQWWRAPMSPPAGPPSMLGVPRSGFAYPEPRVTPDVEERAGQGLPLAPCGCTNVSRCGRSDQWHVAQARNQEANFSLLTSTGVPEEIAETLLRRQSGFGRDLPTFVKSDAPTGQARVTKLDADGKPTGESVTVDNVTVNNSPAEPLSPAEAHEHMLNATGQRQGYLAMAEEQWHPGAGQILPGGSISAGDITVGPRFADYFADDIDSYMADLITGRARADEQALRAMGATGGRREVLFEMDSPDTLLLSGPAVAQRFRVLIRNVDPPVSMDALVSNGALTRYGELAQVVGRAMAECVAKIAEAAAAMVAATDPETGEMKPGEHGG